MQQKLRRIEGRERMDHSHLNSGHRCWYWGEYTPWELTRGKGAEFSETNALIQAFKAAVDTGDAALLASKEAAIQQIAQTFAKFWKWHELIDKDIVLVPMPPSRAINHPLYDNRMSRVVHGIREYSGLDLRVEECLSNSGAFAASHSSKLRPTPQSLLQTMSLHELPADVAQPKMFFVFDDVITTGAHFAIANQLIREHYTDAKVIGTFVARRVTLAHS